ncbi:MAG: YciI family protein [Pirellulaceae bacterium]
MKYLLLIYSQENAWQPEEHQVALAESIELCHTLHEQGRYVHAAPLQPAATAAQVQVREGQTLVSDGPFAETKEQLAGYFMVEAGSREAAIEIAAKIPGTRRGTTEVRQLVELTNMPGENHSLVSNAQSRS